MSAQPDRHLAPVPDERPLIVIDADGVRVGDLDHFTQEMQDQIDGLERDIRGWRTRYANLERDAEAEAQESPVWPAAVRVFDYWRKTCKHPRSEFTLERFEMIRPHLERLGKKKKGRPEDPAERAQWAEEVCMLAVDGINLDCYVTTRKNGTTKRHDGLHLIFDDRFEDRVNSAPLERIREVMGTASASQPTLDQPQPDG